MKLKTLVGSMIVLGVISTGAMAAVPNNVGDTFWKGVVLRNQSNNGSMETLAAGQIKVTGDVKVDLVRSNKRTSFASSKPNTNGATRLNLHTAELFVDSQVNDWAAAHVALNVNSSNSNVPGTGTGLLEEGYAMLTHNDFYLTAGRQFLNFGSTAGNSISTPMAENLSQLNGDAVTVGVLNLNGFYADASIYNGTNYGDPISGSGSTSVYSSEYRTNGYTAEVGYALNQGANSFYGYDGLNAYVDYVANIGDTALIQSVYSSTTTPNVPYKAVGGLAASVGYVTGPFQVLANYTTALQKFSDSSTGAVDQVMAWNGTGAKPSAYNIEADYSWNVNNPSTVTLGFGGSAQALALEQASTTTLKSLAAMGKNSITAAYGYHISKNVSVQGEYDYLKDYGTSDTAYNTAGTGNSAQAVIGRLKVSF